MLKAEEIGKSRDKWRDKLEESAAAGSRDAFRHVMAADGARPLAAVACGTAQVLEQHTQQWGELWKAEARLPQSALGELWCSGFPGGVECAAIGVEELRASASAFSPAPLVLTVCRPGLLCCSAMTC